MDGVVPQLGEVLSPKRAMSYAIEIAYLGRGRVSPNPMVGCVIVDKNHGFLSSGFHARFGEAHAEVNALNGVDVDQLEGATVYVTLEPCSHRGKTGACADLLKELPIARVVFGCIDPNPLVSGQGVSRLQESGIECFEFDELRDELETLIEPFRHWQERRLPFVAVKMATTLDGRYATRDHKSQWITGERARERGHLLRATYDGLLVGVNTLLHDNPKLNVRYPGLKDVQPVVIVLDPSLRLTSANLEIFSTHPREKIIVYHNRPEDVEDIRFQDVFVNSEDGNLVLSEVLQDLAFRNLASVLVEGGGQTISRFLQQSLVDRVHLFMAPFLMGQGLGWTDGFSPEKPLLEKNTLHRRTVEVLGDDIHVSGDLRRFT